MRRASSNLVSIALAAALAVGCVPAAAFAEGAQAAENATAAIVAQANSATSSIVDWTAYGTCEWQITADGTLQIRPASGASRGELGEPVSSSSSMGTSRPWWQYRSDILKATVQGEVTSDDLSFLFYDLYKMQLVDLSGLSTSGATNLSRMFQGCNALQSIDLSHFDTSNAANMSYMFNGCKALESIDVSSFDTSRATDISGMFTGCSSLQAIDVSGFRTSSVTNMSSLFAQCSSLKSINLAMFDTQSLTDWSWMFYNDAALESINLATFDASRATYQSRQTYGYPFLGCTNLRNLTVSGNLNCDMPAPGGDSTTGLWVNAATGTTYEPDSVPKNTAATYGAQATITSDMFSIDLSNETYTGNPITKAVTSQLVEGTDYTVAYENNVNAGTATMTINGAGRYIGSASYNFTIDKATPGAHGYNVDIVCGKPLSSVQLEDGYTWNEPNTHFDNAGTYTAYATYTPKDTANYNVVDNVMFWVTATKVDGAPLVDWTRFGTCEWSISADGVLTIRPADGAKHGELGDFNNSSQRSPWFMYSESIVEVVIKESVSGQVSGGPGSSLFGGLQNMRTCDLSGLDTSSVTSFSDMFYYCQSLESVDLSCLDTSKVTNMHGLFNQCEHLKMVNLSGIDTSNVTDFSGMFISCPSLESVNLSGLNTSKAKSMECMFAGTGLSEIDLSQFDTSNVTTMRRMFYDCPNLQSVDLSSFDMSRVTNTREMFDECPSLERITLSEKCNISNFPEPLGAKTTGKWVNENTGVAYAPAGIPAKTAATYETQLDVREFQFFYNPDDVTYTGNPIAKKVASTLTRGKDYLVAYSNNVNVGTATITITGTGRYGESFEVPFDIVKADPVVPPIKTIEATYGQTLADLTLPEGFAWQTDSTSGTLDQLGTQTYYATYTPSDTNNYNVVANIPVSVHVTNPMQATKDYQHSTTAQSGDVILTVQWDDPVLGQPTTFHASATGGSGSYQFRMDSPTYMDPDGSNESVADPSRDKWLTYTNECTSNDFEFTLEASGTYLMRFYLIDKKSGLYYLRANAFVSASDASHPAVSTIVGNAVTQGRAETNGSEYDMALWLHDWAINQLDYDRSLNWCSAESGLTRGLGTCESYQRIYAKLLDTAGIANGRMEGNGHTWNAVKIDGEWCQADLTWDDTNDNWYGDLDQQHLYFGLNDELMAIAHSDHAKNYQADDYAYRSTGLSNNYFVRNGKAGEWAGAYASRIQQHLDAREESFSIDADNASFPPSISGIQNGIVAYAMNQRVWSVADGNVGLAATSNIETTSSYQWTAKYDFDVNYPAIPMQSGKEKFVRHLYSSILGLAEPSGHQISYWVSQLDSGIAPRQAIMGFLQSDSFRNRKLSNRDTARMLYRAMHGNVNPANYQLDYWQEFLDNGHSVSEAVRGFARTDGYQSMIASYELQDSPNNKEYVKHLYSTILGCNSPTSCQVEYWTSKLSEGASPKDVAKNFYSSTAFANRNLSKKETVRALYASLLLEDNPTSFQTSYWTEQLESGESVNSVIDRFGQTPQYGSMLDKYNL